MSRVFLQPAGDAVGKKNYTNTIISKIPISEIEKFLTPNQSEHIREIYNGKDVPVWGTTPGDKDRKKKQWELMQKGDIALFSGNNTIFSSATVTFKVLNKDLAVELWGWEEPGVTWECVYFLDEVKQHNIHITEFNRLLEYSITNNPIRQFRVLDEEKSLKVLEYFNFKSEKYFENVTRDEYQTLIDKYTEYDSLEIQRIGNSRKEQAFLRNALFGNKKIAKCGICNKEYPTDLLITAHIKKRAECTMEEKLDYKNIVIPMCTFGCDILYEKGYIGVRDGVVKLLKNEHNLTPALQLYIKNIGGTHCDYWNEETKGYFEWHIVHHNG